MQQPRVAVFERVMLGALAPVAYVALVCPPSALLSGRVLHAPPSLRSASFLRRTPGLWMQDPSKDLADPAGNLPAPVWQPKVLMSASLIQDRLRSQLAFDATSDDAVWLLLLAVFWPILLCLNMTVSATRAVEGLITLLNHMHGTQAQPGIPTVYVPRGGGSELLLPVQCKQEALDTSLLQLEVGLRKAVTEEDYAAAHTIQTKIRAIQDSKIDDMAKQLLKKSWKMRREQRSQAAARPDVATLQQRLEAAVNGEDFQKAADLQKQIEQQPAPARADLDFLEWDVRQRVSQMFVAEMLQRQDPIQNLTLTLNELVEVEHYEAAAEVYAELKELERLQEQQKMLSTLVVALKRQREIDMDRQIKELVRQEIWGLRHSQLLKQEAERHCKKESGSSWSPWVASPSQPPLDFPRFEKFSQLQDMHFAHFNQTS